MPSHKILKIAAVEHDLQNLLAKEMGISKIMAQLLLNRGIKTPLEAERFLKSSVDHLLDPYSFRDMQKAVGLIHKSASNKEKVLIYGDYDVDGITSLAILKNTLDKMGVEAIPYIPHRINEGYGLNKNCLAVCRKEKIKLVITADCGTNSHEEIKELRRHNIEIIVTDHHESSTSDLPLASALINPKMTGGKYKFRDLAGVGVAAKLCQALRQESFLEDLDLVALGTIADVVPLTGENRIIAKEGLIRISETKKVGLKALMEKSGIKGKPITGTSVSFILGPRINASGRMDTAETAYHLLVSQDENEAVKLADVIEQHNRRRQGIESKILEEAEALIEKEVNFKEHMVIVIAKENWHQGVLGIVASKIADRFYRPTILISKGLEFCKGSGRSIKNFHLFEAFVECKDFLSSFGGHEHAAGLLVHHDNIEGFKKRINALAKEQLAIEDLLPTLEIDMELKLSDITDKFVRELDMLEPFGVDNPAPLFFTRKLKLKAMPQVLSRDTLKFWVSDGNDTCQAIGFRLGSLKDSLMQAASFDLVYVPSIDSWQGQEKIILEVKEIFFS